MDPSSDAEILPEVSTLSIVTKHRPNNFAHGFQVSTLIQISVRDEKTPLIIPAKHHVSHYHKPTSLQGCPFKEISSDSWPLAREK